MKFLLVLALAVCLCAVIEAYDLCGGCDLSGDWRVKTKADHNDDEALYQFFDGEVDWRDQWREFRVHENAYLNADRPAGTLRQTAHQSCEDAIPNRIYNVRWERQIDDFQYQVRQYVYRGYTPDVDAWSRYCTRRINPDETPEIMPFVESEGESFKSLKGAYTHAEIGIIQATGENDGCRVRFRPRYFEDRCFVKNQDNRFPTSGNSISNVLPYANLEDVSLCSVGETVSGQRSLARYGCHQYTWDDTTGDSIDQSCETMYFVNEFDRPASPNKFQPGLDLPGTFFAVTSSDGASITPAYECEYRVGGVGWNNLAGLSSHPCQ